MPLFGQQLNHDIFHNMCIIYFVFRVIKTNLLPINVIDEHVNYSEKTYQVFFYVCIDVKSTLRVGWVTGRQVQSCITFKNYRGINAFYIYFLFIYCLPIGTIRDLRFYSRYLLYYIILLCIVKNFKNYPFINSKTIT